MGKGNKEESNDIHPVSGCIFLQIVYMYARFFLCLFVVGLGKGGEIVEKNKTTGKGIIVDFKRNLLHDNVFWDIWIWLHPRVLEYRINKYWFGTLEEEGKIRKCIIKFRIKDIENEHFACIYRSDCFEGDMQFILFVNIKDIEKDNVPVYGAIYDQKYKELNKADGLQYFVGDSFYSVYYAEGIVAALNRLLES